MAVIDDCIMQRRLLEVQLEAAGHAVTCFAAGIDFLQKAHEMFWDMIVVDYFMPDVSGYETIQRLDPETLVRSKIAVITGSPEFMEPAEYSHLCQQNVRCLAKSGCLAKDLCAYGQRQGNEAPPGSSRSSLVALVDAPILATATCPPLTAVDAGTRAQWQQELRRMLPQLRPFASLSDTLQVGHPTLCMCGRRVAPDGERLQQVEQIAATCLIVTVEPDEVTLPHAPGKLRVGVGMAAGDLQSGRWLPLCVCHPVRRSPGTPPLQCLALTPVLAQVSRTTASKIVRLGVGMWFGSIDLDNGRAKATATAAEPSVLALVNHQCRVAARAIAAATQPSAPALESCDDREAAISEEVAGLWRASCPSQLLHAARFDPDCLGKGAFAGVPPTLCFGRSVRGNRRCSRAQRLQAIQCWQPSACSKPR